MSRADSEMARGESAAARANGVAKTDKRNPEPKAADCGELCVLPGNPPASPAAGPCEARSLGRGAMRIGNQ
jgi:hypothetical protein